MLHSLRQKQEVLVNVTITNIPTSGSPWNIDSKFTRKETAANASSRVS